MPNAIGVVPDATQLVSRVFAAADCQFGPRRELIRYGVTVRVGSSSMLPAETSPMGVVVTTEPVREFTTSSRSATVVPPARADQAIVHGPVPTAAAEKDSTPEAGAFGPVSADASRLAPDEVAAENAAVD